ncbi:MAG: hypothetical protein AABX73_01785 [Nanoarchaeota archaeon]
MNLSEKETRDAIINPQLKGVGWTKEYFKEEVKYEKPSVLKKKIL